MGNTKRYTLGAFKNVRSHRSIIHNKLFCYVQVCRLECQNQFRQKLVLGCFKYSTFSEKC